MPSIGIGIGIALRTQFLSAGFVNPFDGAAAAYSVRIPGGSTYTGPLIRVRRSSDNAEQDINSVGTMDANGNKALDTSALLTFAGAGNAFVVTWYDQSGNGKNCTQGTAAKQPRIVNAGALDSFNSISSMLFDGINDIFTTTLATTHPFTIASVIKSATTVGPASVAGRAATRASLGILNNPPATNSFLMWSPTLNRGVYKPNSSSTSPTVLSGFGTSVDEASWGIAINGNASGTSVETSGASIDTGNWSIGGNGYASEFWNGYLSEIVIFGSVLSSSSRLVIERNQGIYFGITVA